MLLYCVINYYYQCSVKNILTFTNKGLCDCYFGILDISADVADAMVTDGLNYKYRRLGCLCNLFEYVDLYQF